MAKAYKATAQSMFFKQVTNDFPNWDVVVVDISNGLVTLSSGDIIVNLIYDPKTDEYYPSKVTKQAKGDVAWGADTLDKVRDMFNDLPEIKPKGNV